MKWIGQQIYDQIVRVRDDLYLEDIATQNNYNTR